jgi:hypothetical protein
MRTGRVGYVFAEARGEAAGSAATPALRCRNLRREILIYVPLSSAQAHTQRDRTREQAGNPARHEDAGD